MAVFFDLSEIAAIGSVSILIVHFVVHAGHLRLLRETGAIGLLVVVATLTNLAAIVLSAVYLSGKSPHLLILVGSLFALAVFIELALRFLTGRSVRPRVASAPRL